MYHSCPSRSRLRLHRLIRFTAAASSPAWPHPRPPLLAAPPPTQRRGVCVAPPALLPASRRAPPGLAWGPGAGWAVRPKPGRWRGARPPPPPPPPPRGGGGAIERAITVHLTTDTSRAPVCHTLPEASQLAPSASWLPRPLPRTRPVCGCSSRDWLPAAVPQATRQRRWRSSGRGCNCSSPRTSRPCPPWRSSAALWTRWWRRWAPPTPSEKRGATRCGSFLSCPPPLPSSAP
jgi:hypothetical protein